MPPAKKSASRRRSTTARKRQGAKEPAAIKRLNKALDSAQAALVSLRNDVGKEVKTMEREVQRLQKRIAGGPRAKASSRAGSRRKARSGCATSSNA